MIHVLADLDPRSQNVADPTDSDPKHWIYACQFSKLIFMKTSTGTEHSQEHTLFLN